MMDVDAVDALFVGGIITGIVSMAIAVLYGLVFYFGWMPIVGILTFVVVSYLVGVVPIEVFDV